MTHDEQAEFEKDIVVVAVRTEALVYTHVDREGAIQYALFPRRRMPLELAVLPRRPRRSRRRFHA